MTLSALKFHFLQITFFSAVITRTHHLPKHTPFFRTIMSKKRALHLFLKITFFCSLLLLLTPETLPNHLFRETSDQNWSKNRQKGGKNFSFFYNFFHIFPLPLRKKTKPLTFFRLFITGNRKLQGKMSFKKKFFFFSLFSTVPLLVIGKITIYFFFRNSNLKCPKMPLSALKFHYLQITFFSAVITRTHNLPTHTPFFRHIMFKKRALHLFLKITFFLVCTPSPYPQNTS